MFCFRVTVGDFSACVNAATMALVDAGIPVKDLVCACSATYIEETSMLGEYATYMYNIVIVFSRILQILSRLRSIVGHF